jgi:uncharacterized protein YjbI with pentapeptide repeats
MANTTQLEKLKSGVAAWNKWREENSDMEIDLSEAKLAEVNLTEANLTGASLYGADLRKANLTDANLTGANLNKANLSDAHLSGAKLSGAYLGGVYPLKILKQGVEGWNKLREENPGMEIDLTEASLIRANLASANLAGAILSGSNLNKADLIGADLTGATLYVADLSESKLCEAKLIGADFTRAKFVGADLTSANLTGSILNEADLSGANLTRADLTRAKLSGAFPLEILKQGVEVWNKWREENPGMEIDLTGVSLTGDDITNYTLSGVNLSGVNLRDAKFSETALVKANLTGANLSRADLFGIYISEADLSGANLNFARLENVNLSKANLSKADLSEARLTKANLSGAKLTEAKLINVDLVEADLSEANLTGADLSLADMVRTKVTNAVINKCNVYGTSVWDLQGKFKKQMDLILSSSDDPERINITTNNIKDAQFINLILDNPEIRGVLNTLTSKAVLILGRFANDERKAVLDALRRELPKFDLLPIVFDFERPEDKDFTETIKTLAGMCYFVIADVTNPKSSPLELQATVPDYQIPFVPIIQELEGPFAMMQNLQTKYPWVLDTVSYKDADQLIRILKKGIIDRAKEKRKKLRRIKKRQPKVIMASEFEEEVP